MTEALTPSVGLGVLHLFLAARPGASRSAVEAAVKEA